MDEVKRSEEEKLYDDARAVLPNNMVKGGPRGELIFHSGFKLIGESGREKLVPVDRHSLEMWTGIKGSLCTNCKNTWCKAFKRGVYDCEAYRPERMD